MGKSKAPPPPAAPDTVGASRAEAAGNIQMARYQTDANRINQVNPWGTLSYNRNSTFDTDAYNRAIADWQASGGKGDLRPDRNSFYRDQWTQTETIDPRLQRALDSQLASQQQRSEVSSGMMDRVRRAYGTEFNPTRLGSYTDGLKIDTSKLGRVGEFSTGARINTNSPQFGKNRQDQYAKAAYEGSIGLMRGDMDRQETALNNKLALQGLTPGTEAEKNATGEFQDARSRQLNQLANQAMLTGNQMSNADLNSELAAFQAGNQAQGQQFAIDQGSFDTNRQGTLDNANIRGQENQAMQQAYANALQEYGANWQQEQTLRNMPLNEMNALVNGQQVQANNFQPFAQQGFVGGAQLGNAVGQRAQWDQGIWNQQAAQAANNNAATTSAVGTAATLIAMY